MLCMSELFSTMSNYIFPVWLACCNIFCILLWLVAGNHVLNSYLAWYEIFKTNQLTSDKQFENEKTVAGLYFEKIELPFTILGLYGFKT